MRGAVDDPIGIGIQELMSTAPIEFGFPAQELEWIYKKKVNNKVW